LYPAIVKFYNVAGTNRKHIVLMFPHGVGNQFLIMIFLCFGTSFIDDRTNLYEANANKGLQ
jgi:hypothetical protein